MEVKIWLLKELIITELLVGRCVQIILKRYEIKIVVKDKKE